MAEYKLLINGELVSSSSGKTVDDIGPASGEAIARVPESTLEDVERAVVAAREAFDDGRWSDLTHGARAAALEKLAMLMEAHAQEIAELESQDVGKPIKLARDGDIPFSIDNIHFFAGAARHLAGTAASEYSGGHTSIIRREPVGVVASLAPWNYPFMMAAWKIGPALAAGNTVVLKPSVETPLTTFISNSAVKLPLSSTTMPTSKLQPMAPSSVATSTAARIALPPLVYMCSTISTTPS